MDKNDTFDHEEDFDCPVCGARGKALVGAEAERRMSPPRMKCRKCEADYWENQGRGMIQGETEG